MNKKVKELWLPALRSGAFSQITGVLKKENGYCCLGLLCEVMYPGEFQLNKEEEVYAFRGKKEFLPPDDVADEAGLSRNDLWDLSDKNDNNKMTFPAIADYIEQNL